MSDGLYIFSLDCDWCSESILEWTLDIFLEEAVPVTVFVTGKYECLQNLNNVEIGIHPNFQNLKTEEHEQQITELLDIYSKAISVRAHALYEYSNLLNLYQRAGLKIDSTPLMYLCESIAPYKHPSGMLRLPIFWEDDDYFSLEPSWNIEELNLGLPGIKCFDFHPIHLRLNSWSPEQYNYVKQHNFSEQSILDAEYKGTDKGIRSIFYRLVDYIRKHDVEMCKIGDLCSWD